MRGHTFLENDIDFSQIEKRKKSTAVYLSEDWFKVVRDANQRKPFMVIEMRQEDVFDWKSYILAQYKPLSKDIDRNWVKLRDIHCLNFGWGEDTDNPDKVWVRYEFSKDEPWKKIKIVRNTRLSPGTPDHR